MSATSDPTVLSILTPSLNLCRDLEGAIASVVNQDAQGIQHVIADGGSTDGTVEMLRQAPPSVTWLSSPDSGQSEALNRAASLAQGTWLGWLNGDEFYLPGVLQRVLKSLDTDSADVIYCDFVETDPDGRMVRLVSQHSFSPWLLRYHGCFIPSCATFFRRSLLDEVDGWNVTYKLMMDWDLWLRFLAKGARFTYEPIPAAAFRLRPERLTVAQAACYPGERIRVNDSQGIRNMPALCRAGTRGVRGAMKLMNGNISRQRQAVHLRGQTLEWFDNSPAALNTCRELNRI
ncbi:MAG: glycosyltransferase [Actinomycetota bacterium]|nr:glycosyltransferase [Actinomycetota bacterium]